MEETNTESAEVNATETTDETAETQTDKTVSPIAEPTTPANESDCETLDEAYSSSEHDDDNDDDDEQEKPVPEEKFRRSGSESGEHSDRSGSDASLGLEREEGDGQESAPNRKVDDDEDKRNPQYIPKKGTFYEHDDRTAVEESEVPEEPNEKERLEKENKKKVWQEKESSKWNHDRFSENEQAPKSRTELIAIYGYDIRNEEGPPRARRRRRYGRGPNKYTRNWEDEDAYGKPVVAPPVRKTKTKPGEDEFPPLVSNEATGSDIIVESVEVSDVPTQLHAPDVERQKPEPIPIPIARTEYRQSSPKPNQDDFENQSRRPFNKSQQYQPQQHQQQQQQQQQHQYQQQQRERLINKSKPPPRSSYNEAAGETDTKGYTKTFQFRDTKPPFKSSPPNRKPKEIVNSQNFTNRNLTQQNKMLDVEKDMGRMSMQESGTTTYKNSKYNNGQRQTSVPPRMQAEQKTSKRYSSLRQRSLPETAAPPPFTQHSNYYPNDYSQQNPPTPQQQQTILQHPPTQLHSQLPQNPSQMALPNNPPPIPPISHQGPSNATPIMQAPPQFGPPFPQAPAFLQPGVAPPPFLTQQPPQMINYAQPQFPQPPFTGYQHQPQFTTPPQPPELYQPQGGITYYSTQNQQVMQRAPLKRPKAAIPIVPPPENNRGRGRSDDGSNDSYGGTDNSNGYEEANVQQ